MLDHDTTNQLRARSMNNDPFYRALAAGCLKGACIFRADGSIARGYLIDRCELKSANEYVITWKIPLQGSAKTNFSCVIGSAEYDPVAPGFCTVGLLEDPLKTRVCTFDVQGKPAKRSFHFACFRD